MATGNRTAAARVFENIIFSRSLAQSGKRANPNMPRLELARSLELRRGPLLETRQALNEGRPWS